MEYSELQRPAIKSSFVSLVLFSITFLECSKGVHTFPATAGHILSELVEEQDGVGLHTVPLWKQYVPVHKNNKTIAYKTAYFGHVTVGCPERQTFTAVFDTGSGHFILPSTTCTSDACTKHRRYNRTLSSTAIDINHDETPIAKNAQERDQVSIAFGTGQVAGEFVHDKVCLGDSSSICMKLRVVVATEMSADPFGLFNFDGIIGLSLNALTLNPGFNFFGQLVEQNPRLVAQFSVFLALNDNEESIISFGGYDPERAESELRWAPVAKQELGYWQVWILAVRIGNETLKECNDGSCRAILDTGTSLLGVPQIMARNMHRRLARPVPSQHLANGAAWDKVDCRRVAGKPLEFDLEGGLTVTLKAPDYSRPTTIIASPETDKAHPFCRSLLLPVDMNEALGPKVFIWGEPVLRRYYTVYDLKAKQIGFAPAKSKAGRSSKVAEPLAAPLGSLAAGAPLPKPEDDVESSE